MSEYTYKLDLKWSLWMPHDQEWPVGMLAQIKAGVDAGAQVTVVSRPRKEIRYGTVDLWKNARGQYCADVDFRTEWDDPREIADTLGLPEDDVYAIEQETLGVRTRTRLEQKEFEALIDEVNTVENELLEEDTDSWNDLVLRYLTPEDAAKKGLIPKEAEE